MNTSRWILEVDDECYTDDIAFYKRVGILNEDQLADLGWECDNGNRICYSQHDELVAFIDKLNTQSIHFIKGSIPKKYHIATALDSCELEEEYKEKHHLGEDAIVLGDSIVNRVAYVNRMDYYLCDGDDNEDLYLQFVEEI